MDKSGAEENRERIKMKIINSLLQDKNGEILIGQVLFIVLNILFCVVLILFLVRAGSGAAQTEQEYAKKIALLIDSAKPDTLIVLDVGDAVKIASKSGVDKTAMFGLNGDKKVVSVKLSRYKAYEFGYFSSSAVSLELKGDFLSIKIGKAII